MFKRAVRIVLIGGVAVVLLMTLAMVRQMPRALDL
jgi:hypothetical protein